MASFQKKKEKGNPVKPRQNEDCREKRKKKRKTKGSG